MILFKEKLLKLTSKQKIGSVLILIFLFGLIIVFLEKRQSETKESLVATKIGNDSFSNKDLDYLVDVYFSESRGLPLSPNDKEKLNEIVFERSAVIQEAQERKLISFDEEILKPNKNWLEYNQIYEKAKRAIIAQEEQISVAGIFIYFQNQFPPEMGVVNAKELTRRKMEELRSRLIGGEISLRQASSIITSDVSLAEIDPMYDANAYAEFNKRNRSRQVVGGISPQDNGQLWSLKPGEFSGIFLGYESGNDVVPNEAYWAIFQVTSKTGTGKPYLEWLKEAKAKYGV